MKRLGITVLALLASLAAVPQVVAADVVERWEKPAADYFDQSQATIGDQDRPLCLAAKYCGKKFYFKNRKCRVCNLAYSKGLTNGTIKRSSMRGYCVRQTKAARAYSKNTYGCKGSMVLSGQRVRFIGVVNSRSRLADFSLILDGPSRVPGSGQVKDNSGGMR